MPDFLEPFQGQFGSAAIGAATTTAQAKQQLPRRQALRLDRAAPRQLRDSVQVIHKSSLMNGWPT